MKRAISFFLSLVMVVGICSTMPFAKIDVSAVEGTELFTVQTSGFENDKITYTVYLKKGVSLIGSIIYAEFDSSVLAIDADNTGACMTTDSYGDECQSINGVYEQGFKDDTDNKYSIAHVYGTDADYNAGSSDKPYMQFTFKAIDNNRPKTTVKLYCYEFNSQNTPSNNIPNGSESLILSDTRTTLGQVTIESVKSENGGVRISWEKATGADNYYVYRSIGGEYVLINKTADGDTLNYLDTEVENNNSYSYAVRAVNEASNEDENGEKYPAPISEVVSTKYTAAPSEITVSNICGGIVVEWSAVAGATAYRVYRRTVNADGSVSDWDNFDKITATTYSDTTAVNGTTYQYAIRVYSDVGYSALSVEKEITYLAETHSDGSWVVTSEPNCTDDGLKKKICLVCGEAVEIEVIPAKGHTPGSWKTEKKATVNAAGKKVQKCTECGKTLKTSKIAQLKCSKPKLSKVENTADGVKITWGKVSGADKYYVYRKTGSNGKYSRIGSTSKTYYTDKKASSGKKYYYIVKAINEAGSSDSSSSKSIYYLADTTLSTPKSTKSGITLKWKKVTGADGYMVYRKTGSGSYSKIATVKGNSKVTYTDKKAKKGKTYTYKIKAYKSKTYSAYSNAKKIKDKY